MKSITRFIAGGILLSALCLSAFSATAAPIDEKRAEIERGADFGMQPSEYADRFNSSMSELGQPFTITGDATLDDAGAQATFNDMVTSNIALVGTAKPDSGIMNGFLLTGRGDGTQESGAQLMLAMAGAVSAAAPGMSIQEGMSTVMQLVNDSGMGSGGEEVKATTTTHGIRFALQNSSLVGVMLSATPVE